MPVITVVTTTILVLAILKLTYLLLTHNEDIYQLLSKSLTGSTWLLLV